MRRRARRSGGIPCAEGGVVGDAPRIWVRPRFDARITMGEIEDSKARVKYVKDSRSSMWTLQENVSVSTLAIKIVSIYLIDEEHTRDQLCNALINVLVHDLVDLLP